MTGGRPPSLLRVALLALVMLVTGRGEALAQQDLEDAVKATFLYRFGSFADWPSGSFAEPDAPVVICIAGDSAFAQLVTTSAADQRVAGRAVVVRSVNVVAPQSGCHILYIGYESAQATRDALQATTGDPVLTVTDDRLNNVRGAIHFVLTEGRVRFRIDRRMAERNGVALSSRLLNIALSVAGVSG